MKGLFLSRKFLFITDLEAIFNQEFYSKESLIRSEAGLPGMFLIALGKNTQTILENPLGNRGPDLKAQGEFRFNSQPQTPFQ